MSEFDRYLAPYSKPGRHWILSAIALSALAVVFAAETQRIAEASEELAQEARRLQVQQVRKPKASRIESERNEQWAKLERERRFKWYPLFLALERSSSDDIELLEFLPDKANGQLTLRGEARSMDSLIAYLERLSRQEIVTNAYLGHQKNMMRDALPSLAFEIKATLRKE